MIILFLKGKTTQTAQFILDDQILKNQGSQCRIICSQPRRISGKSILSPLSI
jgi:HrpA-like RNA helicase